MSAELSSRAAQAACLLLLVFALGQSGHAKPPRQAARKPANKAEAKPSRASESQSQDSSEAAAKTADRAAFQTATFGAGCFWCSEAVFRQLKGVHAVVSGYSGGLLPNPTYEQVCSELTGHAEAVQITFDPEEISYDELLEVFWRTHDPTTLNRQGPDFGTQYRSVVFYHNDEQQELAERYKQKLAKEHVFRKPIVTELAKFEAFYPAEAYHQNYYNSHRGDAYCSAVIRPKVTKVKKVFKDKLSAQAVKPRSQ